MSQYDGYYSQANFQNNADLINDKKYLLEKQPQRSRFNPRGWRRRTKIAAAVGVVVVIVAATVGGYEGYELNRYPDYSPLNYSLQEEYSGTSFFDDWIYWDTYDPNQGFVHYVDQQAATSQNLTSATSDSAVLKVDTTDTDASTGRDSVRISSKNTYNDGLFIFDILHLPYGCATWPSVWLTDQSNWPTNGEIDVLEAVNQGTSGNQMTLHTTEGCDMTAVKREETGSVATSNCYNGTDDNAGCGVQGPADTYGPQFNANGGGVYAMELRSAGIRVWFFPRTGIPADISNGSAPDPSSWGTALADFPSTSCDIASHFQNQSIVVDIDLCGTWAGATSVYSGQDSCPGTCSQFVTSNATAFETAYWEFKSFKVYQAS